MNTYHYDLHIHSCLSPCGDNDMTPNNLVQMALLSGCDVIALTDHNTCRNAPAAMEAGARNGLLVIPGMELCTAEEAHVVCLFETLEGALEFDHYIYENMPHVKNRPEIFGEQRLLDGEDAPVGEEENLLLVSSFVGVDQVVGLAAQYGGVAFPAHVDRDSFSVIASLGAIPAEAGFTAAFPGLFAYNAFTVGLGEAIACYVLGLLLLQLLPRIPGFQARLSPRA